MSSLRAVAPGKINLSLRLQSRDKEGMHPLVSLAQSIGRWDIVTMQEAEDDALEAVGADLPTGSGNLVWKAVEALRRETGREVPVEITLTKRLPTAAGLGGGSADAAAALRLYADIAGVGAEAIDKVAPGVGSDVPFCLVGGLRKMHGYGEGLSPSLEIADDYWVVVAVPPFELSTPRVYEAWDKIGEPDGLAVSGNSLPPSLRGHAPLVNDLYPAAVSLEPILDDWRSQLAESWDRPVLLSGSGPSLFAFFSDQAEAEGALSLVPQEARSAFAAPPIGYGARRDEQ
jgi:4-diphosphocytidyl-2-C-methyl-D-erythritol kinase